VSLPPNPAAEGSNSIAGPSAETSCSHSPSQAGHDADDEQQVSPSLASESAGSPGEEDGVPGGGDWYEPHPGRRLPLASSLPGAASDDKTPTSTLTGTTISVLSTGSRGGDTAAKGRCPHGNYYNRTPPRPRLYRRAPRTRRSLLKPLSIPGRSVAPISTMSTPRVISHDSMIPTLPVSSTSVITIKAAPLPAAVIEMIEPTTPPIADAGAQDNPIIADSDIEMTCSVPSVGAPTPSPTPSPSPPVLADLSCHLAPDADATDDNASVTVVDSDSCSQRVSMTGEDPYGWEAEWDRKSLVDEEMCCQAFEYRRANGTKRSLLHRVFSIGQASNKTFSTPLRRMSVGSLVSLGSTIKDGKHH
jgi:hypothetical protein